jgi:hypothetical protein
MDFIVGSDNNINNMNNNTKINNNNNPNNNPNNNNNNNIIPYTHKLPKTKLNQIILQRILFN